MRFRFLVVFLLLAGTGFSQSFTGTLDGYWSVNFNKPLVPGSEHINDFRAFDIRDRQFAFNYGELAVEYKPGKAGFRVDVGFGDTAKQVELAEPAGNDPNGFDLWRHIQQAYLTVGHDKWTFDFGKFVTPLGAEVIETKDNWNYSRGLLFTWGIPFYHMGARATLAASDSVTLAGYVVNGWDNVKDLNTAKSFGFMGTFKPGILTLTTNYLVGKENPDTDETRTILDGIAILDFSDEFAMMFNYDYGYDKGPDLLIGVSGPRVIWQGFAGYMKIGVLDKITFVPRYEWFQDRDGFRTGTAQELQSFSFTGQIPVEDAKLWLEYRRDWSDKDVFNTSGEGVFGPRLGIRSYQNTFTLGLTYAITKGTK